MKYYTWFKDYQTKYLFIGSLPFVIGDIWRLNSAKDLLECYGYPTEQPSDKLEEVFEKFYDDCRSLEGMLPAWYTLDGVTAWIDDYLAPQPYDYEEEVDYVFQYPVGDTDSVYEALYQAINEVMRREFKWLLETKLESIRQLHPGIPLWQDGEFRELTDEDLVAYGYQRLGVKGTMKQARESAEQRVKVLSKK